MINISIFNKEDVEAFTKAFEEQLISFKARFDELISQNPDITDSELFKQNSLIRDELLIQCNNIEYSDKDLYLPYLAVSNMGRVWNIKTGKWLVPSADGCNRDYWRINSKFNGVPIKIKVHRLVKFYFLDDSDKVCLKHYSFDKTEVHHKIESHIPENLKSTGYIEDKIWNCMQLNSASNLQIIDISHHRDNTKIMNGYNTNYIDADTLTRMIINTSGHYQNPQNSTSVIYSEDENGNVLTTVNITARLNSSINPKNLI